MRNVVDFNGTTTTKFCVVRNGDFICFHSTDKELTLDFYISWFFSSNVFVERCWYEKIRLHRIHGVYEKVKKENKPLHFGPFYLNIFIYL